MKGPEAFRTISEAALELGVPQHVLRFWETKFSFIRPMKRAGGRRFYRRQDIDVLRGVRTLLHDEGYTIKGVQRLHKEQGVRRLLEAGVSTGDAAGGGAGPSAFDDALVFDIVAEADEPEALEDGELDAPPYPTAVAPRPAVPRPQIRPAAAPSTQPPTPAASKPAPTPAPSAPVETAPTAPLGGSIARLFDIPPSGVSQTPPAPPPSALDETPSPDISASADERPGSAHDAGERPASALPAEADMDISAPPSAPQAAAARTEDVMASPSSGDGAAPLARGAEAIVFDASADPRPILDAAARARLTAVLGDLEAVKVRLDGLLRVRF